MDEYREAVKEFYRVYRPLQKKHNLRMHSRFSIYDDGFIEIWEYTGEQRGKCVCKVKEEKDVECYNNNAEKFRNSYDTLKMRLSMSQEYNTPIVSETDTMGGESGG